MFGVPWVQVVTGHRGVVAHEPAEIEVASVIPGGNPPLRDIREPDVAPDFGAALGAARRLPRWRRSRGSCRGGGPRAPCRCPSRSAASPPPPLPPDPYTAALVRLDAHRRRSAGPTRGDVDRHYEAVADALRDYLEAAEELPARERTTTELLWSLPPRLAEGGLRRRVQDVLGEADLVKFAKLPASVPTRPPATPRAPAICSTGGTAPHAASEELDAVR